MIQRDWQPQITRATHDLNDVSAIEVTGWPGAHVVYHNHDGHNVEIIAVKRHPGEFYTFARPVSGTLRAHSDLLGDPQMRAIDPGVPLAIYLPPDRVGIPVVVKP